jgi:2-(3-amino-3-carboxypropyl)histidine synthase
MRVLHIPCYSLSDPLPILADGLGILKEHSSAVVVGTAQHLNRLQDIADYLRSKGMKADVGGQVLGCFQDSALGLDADCILYVGSGRFHPLGIAFKCDKPVYMLNPLSGVLDRITDEEKRRWLGRRKGAISRALNSQTFGIMVSTKDGQFDLKGALKLKARLEDAGKEAFIFAAEELSPSNLLPFRVDCWINTACPRIAGDEYHRPVINADDIECLIGAL